LEWNPIAWEGGAFDRSNGPKQLVVDILSKRNSFEFGKTIRKQYLNGDSFDLLYSIEFCEHMPPDRHIDAAKFFAGLSRYGTKLIFGAAIPGQGGTSHIGMRTKKQWEEILLSVGFVKDDAETDAVTFTLNEFNHKVTTQVFFYRGGDVSPF
jgi:hypothetical protein